MNQGGGLVLVVVGLAVLWLAVTGKLNALFASIGNGQQPFTGFGGNGNFQGSGGGSDWGGTGSTNAPYGINPELGTPRSRPQYDPSTPVKPTSSTGGMSSSVFAGVNWPYSPVLS